MRKFILWLVLVVCFLLFSCGGYFILNNHKRDIYTDIELRLHKIERKNKDMQREIDELKRIFHKYRNKK